MDGVNGSFLADLGLAARLRGQLARRGKVADRRGATAGE